MYLEDGGLPDFQKWVPIYQQFFLSLLQQHPCSWIPSTVLLESSALKLFYGELHLSRCHLKQYCPFVQRLQLPNHRKESPAVCLVLPRKNVSPMSCAFFSNGVIFSSQPLLNSSTENVGSDVF